MRDDHRFVEKVLSPAVLGVVLPAHHVALVSLHLNLHLHNRRNDAQAAVVFAQRTHLPGLEREVHVGILEERHRPEVGRPEADLALVFFVGDDLNAICAPVLSHGVPVRYNRLVDEAAARRNSEMEMVIPSWRWSQLSTDRSPEIESFVRESFNSPKYKKK